MLSIRVNSEITAEAHQVAPNPSNEDLTPARLHLVHGKFDGVLSIWLGVEDAASFAEETGDEKCPAEVAEQDDEDVAGVRPQRSPSPESGNEYCEYISLSACG